MDDAYGGSGVAQQSLQKNKRMNAGAWLLTYSDIITLLFTFVLIILKVSDINENRFNDLREGLSETFFKQDVSTAFKTFSEEIKQLTDKYEDIQIKSTNSEIIINLGSADYFDVGQADLKEDALNRIGEIFKVLGDSPEQIFMIEVEGHTDDVPIKNAQFQSNWELSTARATNVVRFFESMGIRRDKLRAIGYAESQPLPETLDADGNFIVEKRGLNRRILISIKKSGK